MEIDEDHIVMFSKLVMLANYYYLYNEHQSIRAFIISMSSMLTILINIILIRVHQF